MARAQSSRSCISTIAFNEAVRRRRASAIEPAGEPINEDLEVAMLRSLATQADLALTPELVEEREGTSRM
ncbi:MAG: hypothetical protein M3P18_25855 [Actinomycetota bacterium]|nr:hypothetical protein [Actinomycetota bacterium]